MAEKLLKCENCGFEEKLTKAKVKARTQANTLEKCSQCGADLPNTDENNTLNTETGSVGQVNPDISKTENPETNIADRVQHDTQTDVVVADTASVEPEAEEKANDIQEAIAAPSTSDENKLIVNDEGNASPEPESEADSDASTEEKTDSLKQSMKDKADTAKENVKKFTDEAKAKIKNVIAEGKENPLLGSDMTGKLMDKLYGLFCLDCLNKTDGFLKKLGYYVLSIAAVLTILLGAAISIRVLSLGPVLRCLGFAAILMLAQHLAVRSFALQEKLLASENDYKLTSPKLPAILGVVSLAVAIFGLIVAIEAFPSAYALAMGLTMAVGAFYASILFMRSPESNSLQYDEKISASEQIFGLTALLAKVQMKASPIMFGLGSLVACVAGGWPLYTMLIQGDIGSMTALVQLAFILPLILYCVFAPLLSYICALFCFMIINLLRGIINLNSK